jgi:hypothetical protein
LLTSFPNSNHSTAVEAHAPTVLRGLRARGKGYWYARKPGELGATITHLEQRIRSMAAAANGLRKAFDG